jgi:hypothetical protein
MINNSLAKKIIIISISVLALVALTFAGLIVLNLVKSPIGEYRDPSLVVTIYPSESLRVHSDFDGLIGMVVSARDEQGIVVTITNYTKDYLHTGLGFQIEQFDGQDWWHVPNPTPAFALPITLPPSEPIDISHSLYHTVGTLPSGHYRIRNRINVPRDANAPPIDVYNYHYYIHEFVAEFHVN